MLATSIPSHSLRSNNDNSLSVPRVKTNTGARAFHSCAPSLWNNLPLSVHSASSVATFKNIWRHISLIWPFPHRYRHSPWSVDVTELFPRFCCWTLIWLSHHWAWLRRGYWRYRSLIDWLIDWLIPLCLKRPIMYTVILPAMTCGAETWGLTKHQEKKLAVAQRSVERLLLIITKRDKIRNEIIRCKTGVKHIIECGAWEDSG